MEVSSSTTRWQHFLKNSEFLRLRVEQERVQTMDLWNVKMVQLSERNSDTGIFLEYLLQESIDSTWNILSHISISIVPVIFPRRYVKKMGKWEFSIRWRTVWHLTRNLSHFLTGNLIYERNSQKSYSKDFRKEKHHFRLRKKRKKQEMNSWKLLFQSFSIYYL